ncbi:MAG TPA: metalloregulator ArsR/SmtB family transcription factor [Lysobacter sp.]|nr:metalloregulator ArsR/SmtB family transcription factor [Lysobacter sp.]
MSRLPKRGASAPPPPAIDPDAMRAHAGEAVRLLKALGNEKRLMLLCMLVEGEQSVGELNAHLDLSQSALSQHLALLREDGLVQTRREAQSIFYSLADGPARRIISTLHSIYCAADAPQPEPSP